jgi:hypothetical protein
VNAGRRHWEQAAEALDRQPEDIKVVVELTA